MTDGDPASIAFCAGAELNDIRCSPFRVPVARHAEALAAIAVKGGATTKEKYLTVQGRLFWVYMQVSGGLNASSSTSRRMSLKLWEKSILEKRLHLTLADYGAVERRTYRICSNICVLLEARSKAPQLGEQAVVPISIRRTGQSRLPQTGVLPYDPRMRSPRGRATNFITGLGRQQPVRDVAALMDNRPPETMAPEHRALVLKGLEAVRNGDVATEEELEALFVRYRL